MSEKIYKSKTKRRKDTATKRELDILRMIDGSIKKYGFPPTRAEICRYFDFKSTNAASVFVRRSFLWKALTYISRYE